MPHNSFYEQLAHIGTPQEIKEIIHLMTLGFMETTLADDRVSRVKVLELQEALIALN